MTRLTEPIVTPRNFTGAPSSSPFSELSKYAIISFVRENSFDEPNSSKPITPSATPTTMNSPMEVVLIFLLIWHAG